MSKATRYLLAALAASLMVSSAQAATFSLLGAGNWSNQSISGLASGTSQSTTSDLGLGGGAQLDFRLVHGLMFEVGALYVTQKLDLSTTAAGATSTQTMTSHYVQVPVLLRFRLLPLMTVGLGGFGERRMGTPTNGSSLPLSDFGLEGAAGFRLPLTMSTRLILEGRYLYGLTNLTSSTGVTSKWRDVQAVVGLSFPLGYRSY